MADELTKVSDLFGKILMKVEQINNDQIVFTLEDGEQYHLYHSQDCCEHVIIDDVTGDLEDLIGSRITKAEESTSDENPEGVNKGHQESFTWTFYHFATVNGYVTIRWYGESNGYYSESVDFGKLS